MGVGCRQTYSDTNTEQRGMSLLTNENKFEKYIFCYKGLLKGAREITMSEKLNLRKGRLVFTLTPSEVTGGLLVTVYPKSITMPLGVSRGMEEGHLLTNSHKGDQPGGRREEGTDTMEKQRPQRAGGSTERINRTLAQGGPVSLTRSPFTTIPPLCGPSFTLCWDKGGVGGGGVW